MEIAPCNTLNIAVAAVWNVGMKCCWHRSDSSSRLVIQGPTVVVLILLNKKVANRLGRV
jgi:hypothetical protein